MQNLKYINTKYVIVAAQVPHKDRRANRENLRSDEQGCGRQACAGSDDGDDADGDGSPLDKDDQGIRCL